MKYIFALILLWATSCANTESTGEQSSVDSIAVQIDSSINHSNSKIETAKTDSAAIIHTNPPKSVAIPSNNHDVKPSVDQGAKPSIISQTDKTATYHYYKNSKTVSVKISAWNENKRTIEFFDPFGNKTYSITDEKHSWSSITTLKFHDNGAVKKSVTNMNPGASMYTYHTTISYSINNEPEWSVREEIPAKDPFSQETKMYWDKKTKSWVKQEIVKEQPVPEDFRK